MRYSSTPLLAVTIFVSGLLGSVQALAAEATLQDLKAGSAFDFFDDFELGGPGGTVTIVYKAGRGFFSSEQEARCYFIAGPSGSVSKVPHGTGWRLKYAPRPAWNDYFASLRSNVGSEIIYLRCEKEAGSTIPLIPFLEAFAQTRVRVTPK